MTTTETPTAVVAVTPLATMTDAIKIARDWDGRTDLNIDLFELRAEQVIAQCRDAVTLRAIADLADDAYVGVHEYESHAHGIVINVRVDGHYRGMPVHVWSSFTKGADLDVIRSFVPVDPDDNGLRLLDALAGDASREG